MRRSSEAALHHANGAQAAIVRALSKELEKLDPQSRAAAALRRQIAEETGRLAFRGAVARPTRALPADTRPLRGRSSAVGVGAAGRPRVLLVDDDDGTRTALAEWLSDEYEVATACDGVEAMTLAMAFLPDVVVADVWMPRLDGIAMLRRMRQVDSLRAVPVLFLTGQTSPDSVEAGIAAGAAAYLEKPVELDVLDRELRAALEAARP